MAKAFAIVLEYIFGVVPRDERQLPLGAASLLVDIPAAHEQANTKSFTNSKL